MAAEAKLMGDALNGLVFGVGFGKDGFAAPDGVKGPSGDAECGSIKLHCALQPGEELVLYFRNKGPYNAVVLTSRRFIKIEDGKLVSNVQLADIARAEHEKNGVFRWDKVRTVLASGAVETFGIYQGAVAEYFTNLLNRTVAARATRGEDNAK